MIDKLEWNKESLTYPFITVTPARDMYESVTWFKKKIPINIRTQTLYTNLISVEMSDYNAILGMDWLSTHHAVIDCQKKHVLFQSPEGEKFEFKGTSRSKLVPTIFELKAKRLLESECYGYLANIMDNAKEDKTRPKDIPMMREYLKVFPDDLMSLPSDREVDFSIDLIPGAALISKAPYRLGPAELKELKTQLQELLDKGFIRPSYSP